MKNGSSREFVTIAERQIFASIGTRAPGFTPEWNVKPGTPDYALTRIFTRYAGMFRVGLDQVPERAFLSFLGMMGTRLMPPSAARAPLVFKLMQTATGDPVLAADSMVAAPEQPQPASPLLSEQEDTTRKNTAKSPPVVFSTEREIALARTKIKAFFSLNPDNDEFTDHSAHLENGFTLFADAMQIEHILYLGHDRLFALKADADNAAEIRISVKLAPHGPAAQSLDVVWEYFAEDGWRRLSVANQAGLELDGTGGFRNDGQVVLEKRCGPDAKRAEVVGRTSFWIRAVLETRLPPQGVVAASDPERKAERLNSDAGPLVDTIRAAVNFTKKNLCPDAGATDAFALDLSNPFYPFGQQPVQFTTFYLASKDVFSRAGAEVTIRFSLLQLKDPAVTAELTWEYFDGANWKELQLIDPTAFNFANPTTMPGYEGKVTFLASPNWKPTLVAGTESFWLRARIDKGDYGHPVRVTVVNDPITKTSQVIAEQSTLNPPAIGPVTLDYKLQTAAEPLDHCLSVNAFVEADHTRAAYWPGIYFRPFVAVDELQPAVHIGFGEESLPNGLVSIFVDVPNIEEEAADLGEAPPFVWEYRALNGWTELGVLDETLGFQRRGMIQFVGPQDAMPISGRGGVLRRIRARLKLSQRATERRISGVWLNAVWATNRELVNREQLGLSDGSVLQLFRFRPRTDDLSPSGDDSSPTDAAERPAVVRRFTPVLPGEIIEVREWKGRGDGWRTALVRLDDTDLRIARDPVTREATAVWVRWHEVPNGRTHLFDSKAGDRHYVIERAEGSLQFGDGVHGRIPPSGAPIVATFHTGGGANGNVAAATITELRSAVAFFESVKNPVPASGGSGTEKLDAARDRGAQRFRHGGRAITARDIESLAREASPAVARARCLALTGPLGQPQRGWVSIAILTLGKEAQPEPLPELRRIVRSFLAERLPAGVGSRVRIVTPEYIPVGVLAEVVAREPCRSAQLEARLLKHFDAFLHPVAGGLDRRGWKFGQALHLSDLAALLRIEELAREIDFVSSLAMRVGQRIQGDRVDVPRDALIAAGDHEVKLTIGEH